jgi:hypothetical protein
MDEYKIDPTIQYDVVPLPSNGIYYPNKKKSLKVAYLTALDENILASPNLMNNNNVIDELLKAKVLDRETPIDDLVEEDRQAILIFLRNTSFGTEYFLILTDPKTSKEFETTIDLSVLKVKDFTLKEDSNGEYSYHFQKSKIDITFKFLNRKEEQDITNTIDNWNSIGVAPVATKRLEMMIKSVKGNKDPMNLRNFISRLPITDSQDFRKFVKENKPGLDLSLNIKAPSGEMIQSQIGFGVEFFRPFYGLQKDTIS